MLLAARRSDVDKVVTVAANLDLAYWTRRDRLAPLVGSLDPAGVAGAMGTIPQVHLEQIQANRTHAVHARGRQTTRKSVPVDAAHRPSGLTRGMTAMA